MAFKDNMPTMQSKSATTPTGEESMIPVSQPPGLGELTASMVTETDKRLEVIQRAQISSLAGADKTKEPQEKISKRQSPTLATQPKKYTLELWVEIETSAGVYSTPKEDSYSVDFAIDALNRAYPGCTGMYLAICWPSTVRRLILGLASSMIRLSLPVKQSSIFPLGWDTLLDGGCDA